MCEAILRRINSDKIPNISALAPPSEIDLGFFPEIKEKTFNLKDFHKNGEYNLDDDSIWLMNNVNFRSSTFCSFRVWLRLIRLTSSENQRVSPSMRADYSPDAIIIHQFLLFLLYSKTLLKVRIRCFLLLLPCSFLFAASRTMIFCSLVLTTIWKYINLEPHQSFSFPFWS